MILAGKYFLTGAWCKMKVTEFDFVECINLKPNQNRTGTVACLWALGLPLSWCKEGQGPGAAGPPHSRGIRARPGLPARACPAAPAREQSGLGGISLRPDWDVGLWADRAQLSRAHGRAGLWHGEAVAQAEPKHRSLSQKQVPQAGVGCGCRLLVTQHCQGACPHGFGGVGLPWAVLALSRLWASLGKCPWGGARIWGPYTWEGNAGVDITGWLRVNTSINVVSVTLHPVTLWHGVMQHYCLGICLN